MAQDWNRSVANDGLNLHHLSTLPVIWSDGAAISQSIDLEAAIAGDEHGVLLEPLQGSPVRQVEHGRVELFGRYACFSCPKDFGSDNQLAKHGKDEGPGHPPYGCLCGKSYSQSKSLTRHLDSVPKHSCPVCAKHDGKKGFPRRDHLLQHVRHMHKFEDKGINFMNGRAGNTIPSPGKYPCPFCSEYDGAGGLTSRDDLLQHIRGTHKCGERGIALMDGRAAQPSL
ncbi:hypothetical protein GGR51DRAFT_568866 [Nemania sp. FL0031]|nr:hypothetical protein GGR51DRAFT_568866 [Nemania sp. FL0031]